MLSVNQLTEMQLNDLERLCILCRKTDGGIPNLYTHILAQPRSLPSICLHYEKKQLIGFISAYFFYDDAVEIGLLVAPSNRNKGIATQLIQSILPLLKACNYNYLIFTSPSHLNDMWLTAKGFIYQHSEYYMERNDLIPLLEVNQSLEFRRATKEDIPIISSLDSVCFGKPPSETFNRFNNIIEDRNYLILIATQNNETIGKAHFRWQPRGASLSNIAILPTLQGKGLGTALISHCINYALSEGKPHLNLDVETHNHRALNLYTRLGFYIQNACDYWTIGINQLNFGQ